MKDVDTQLKIARARIRELELQANQFQNLQQQKDARLQALERLLGASTTAQALEAAENRCATLEEDLLQKTAEARSLREQCESLQKEVRAARENSKPIRVSGNNRTKPPLEAPSTPITTLRVGPLPEFDLNRVYVLPNGHRIRVKEKKEDQILIERQSDGKVRWVSAWEFQEGLGSST